MPRIVKAADLFCGAGGTSAGMLAAARQLDLRLDLVAVNHWPLAIQTHMANHPWARHICASLTPIDTPAESMLFETGVDAVDPRKAVPGGKLDLLVASPECTHHSIARGGRPRSDQSRATPWCVLRWADALQPDGILLENVREFRDWGPLNAKGKVIASRKGETFKAFLDAIVSLGYRVEYRIICCADYGDPTTRPRLFVLARRGRRRIIWPQTSHARDASAGRQRWRSAREIIDWSLPGKSIFNRRQPLVRKSIDRIAAGLRTFGGEAAQPFLVMLYGTGKARSIDLPLPTVTAQGNHIALVEPFITALAHTADGPRVRSVDEPMPTITGTRTWALVEPFLIKYYRTGTARPIDMPLDTVTTRDRFGLVEPVAVADQDGKAWGLDIRYRMLQPHELAAAMSFPEDYQFFGTKDEVVKQIGNAVPGRTACALSRQLMVA